MVKVFSLLSFSKPRSYPNQKPRHHHTEPLFFLWVTFAGILLFAGYLLYQKGIWASLISADPTYLTALILFLFVCSTAWVGFRANTLTYECEQFAIFENLLLTNPTAAKEWLSQASHSWAHDFFTGLRSKGAHWRESSQLIDLLGEKAAGPQEMAWWVNGTLLKLGLLGKVIGFSIMALQLGAMDSFDSGQTSAVLKTLTGGLGIALLTTMTGLAANLLLGIQLMRLDRFADYLTAKAIQISEVDLKIIMGSE